MIGKRIKAARLAKGLTQVQLADKLNVTQKYLSRWETGERVPALESIKILCEVLEISADYLIGIKKHEEYNDIL